VTVALVIHFVLGACVGSFLNVCIARWPHDQSVVAPRSRCPKCGLAIGWRDNVPVLSWLLLRGRCRGCELPISAQYPAVEVLVGIVWLASAAAYGPGFTAVRVAVFATLMLGIAVTDARHYLIPDGFTVFGLAFVLVASLAAGVMGDPGPFAGPWDALIGACAGAGAIAIVGWLGEVMLKREAMGFGDVTLMAVVGGAVGPGRSLLVIFLGAALGAVAFLAVVYPWVRLRAGRQGARGEQIDLGLEPPRGELPEVPFGVFLAPAAIVVLVWGEAITAWYLTRVMAVS
jgi:leader peptidase (prepilin peptidase) / N-methyltransferase